MTFAMKLNAFNIPCHFLRLSKCIFEQEENLRRNFNKDKIRKDLAVSGESDTSTWTVKSFQLKKISIALDSKV